MTAKKKRGRPRSAAMDWACYPHRCHRCACK
ncbi:hypothetical protein FCN80_13525 [Martelella alba]|uniref:Uncharacterized protein n=1 Tax=Martelella alba TaxID=2590451 RepID=A0ABY2SPF3_9HYPH|nr:hypothetical protein FCN80_13525 [Martelella alba]